MPVSDHVKADILLILTTFLAASGWMFSKFSLEGLSPLLFITIRFTAAGLFLLLVGGYNELKKLSTIQWRSALISGSLFATAMMFWILGLNLATHVGVGAFLTSLGVVLVPVVGLFFGERPSKSAWISLPVVVIGLACLSLDHSFVMGLGELSFLAAAGCFAIGFIFTSRASASMSSLAVTTIQLLMTGALACVISGFFETWQLNQTTEIWLWVAASIFIATSLRFFIQISAQGMAPPSHAAIILTLEPIWTATLASFLLQEVMSPLQFIGCSLIFASMLINRWRLIQILILRLRTSAS